MKMGCFPDSRLNVDTRYLAQPSGLSVRNELIMTKDTPSKDHSLTISQRPDLLRRVLKTAHHTDRQREFLGWVTLPSSSVRTEPIVGPVANNINGCRLGDAACRTAIPLYHFLAIVPLGEITLEPTSPP